MAFFKERGFSGTRSNTRARLSGEPSSLCALRSQDSVLRSQDSGRAQGSHSEPILSLITTIKQCLCHSSIGACRNLTRSPLLNHRNPLFLLYLQHDHVFSGAFGVRSSDHDSSDGFEFLTMLDRCNVYKIAIFQSCFCKELCLCRTHFHPIHLRHTISG